VKVSIVNLPWIENEGWGTRAGGRFPSLLGAQRTSYLPFPYLLAYTASSLEAEGFDVTLMDGVAQNDTRESICRKIAASRTLPSYGGSAERLSDLRDGLTVS